MVSAPRTPYLAIAAIALLLPEKIQMKNQNKNMYPHVEAWKQSGISLTAYAKSIGMQPAAFEYWVKKFRKEQKKADVGFVELLPASSQQGVLTQSGQIPTGQPQGNIVLSLANGMSIKISF